MVLTIAQHSAKLFNLGVNIFVNNPNEFKFNFALNELPLSDDDSTLGFYQKKLQGDVSGMTNPEKQYLCQSFWQYGYVRFIMDLMLHDMKKAHVL